VQLTCGTLPPMRVCIGWKILGICLLFWQSGLSSETEESVPEHASFKSDMEYTAADGSQKTISREEAMANMENQKKFKVEDGRIIKEDEGKLKLDEVEEKDPEMAGFIRLGNVALQELQKFGHAPGDMINLKTSPRSTEEHVKQEKVLLLVLTVADSENSVSRFEAAIKIDTKHHRIVLIEAWILDEELQRTAGINIPAPDDPKDPISGARFAVIFLGVLLSTMALKALRVRFFSGNTNKEQTRAATKLAAAGAATDPDRGPGESKASAKPIRKPELRKRTMKPPKR